MTKEITVPGEVLAEGLDFVPSTGTFRDGKLIVASQLGLVDRTGRVIKVIPLSGRYLPKVGDTVIGVVVNIIFNGWIVDIGYAYEATLLLKDGSSEYIEKNANLSRYYDFGDIITAKVINVTRSGMDITTKGPGLRKLKGGRIIKVTPSKVPRIIGKQGSMITLIKDKTDCRITVGQNGWVWMQGFEPVKELLAARAILEIEANAHKSGLTERIQQFLERESKK